MRFVLPIGIAAYLMIAFSITLTGCTNKLEHDVITVIPEDPKSYIDGKWRLAQHGGSTRSLFVLKGGYLYTERKDEPNPDSAPRKVIAMKIRRSGPLSFTCLHAVKIGNFTKVAYLPTTIQLRSDGSLQFHTAAQKVNPLDLDQQRCYRGVHSCE